MSKLLKLKEWLTLEEAVQHISRKINETITVADLYRSAIDGDLKLSIYFVNSAFAIKGELCNVGDIKDQLPQQGLDINDSTVHDIEGIWDLTMQGQEALEIKGYYEQINSGLKVTTLSRNGILLQQDGVACRLYKSFERERIFNPKYNESEERRRAIAEEPMRALENHPSIITPSIRKNKLGQEFLPSHTLTENGVLVVRSSEVTHFTQLLEDAPQEEKIITSNERNSLLVLIAALCRHSDFDWNQRGIATSLVAITDLLGVTLSNDTIRKILKQLDPAISSRSK